MSRKDRDRAPEAPVVEETKPVTTEPVVGDGATGKDIPAPAAEGPFPFNEPQPGGPHGTNAHPVGDDGAIRTDQPIKTPAMAQPGDPPHAVPVVDAENPPRPVLGVHGTNQEPVGDDHSIRADQPVQQGPDTGAGRIAADIDRMARYRVRVVGPGSLLAGGRFVEPGQEVEVSGQDLIDHGALIERV